MTHHLPECPWPEKPCGPSHEPMHDRQPLFCVACLTECDCERLRACEQRVREERPWMADWTAGNKQGWSDALQAARDAVAALRKAEATFYVLEVQNAYDMGALHALAAIDALREKP